MDANGLDAVVLYPAMAVVGPADMDINEASAGLGWRTGTWVANGNLVPRHLGIPSVTVPIGHDGRHPDSHRVDDLGPRRAGMTRSSVELAAAIEATGDRREEGLPRTPRL